MPQMRQVSDTQGRIVKKKMPLSCSLSAEDVFEHSEIVSRVSFRACRDVVERIASHDWIDGEYFSLRDAEILERAAFHIRQKIAERWKKS